MPETMVFGGRSWTRMAMLEVVLGLVGWWRTCVLVGCRDGERTLHEVEK
jgi:hypothetical protein